MPNTPVAQPIDEVSGGIGMLQVLAGLFAIALALFDVFFIYYSLPFAQFTNGTLHIIVRVAVIFTLLTLSTITFSAVWACLSLLSRVWHAPKDILGPISIQLTGTIFAYFLIYSINLGIVILFI